jgi:hypothetical protein
MIDISKHELVKQAYELCLAIEKLPASKEQTEAAILATELLSSIQKELDK